MTIAGHNSVNLLQQVAQHVVLFIKKKRVSSPSPSDSFVLKLHYRYTFWFLLFIYCTVFYQWYQKESLTCINAYNAEAQVKMDYMNFCLSYVFTHDDNDPSQRRYLFFYRWLHWVLLILAGLYYVPWKMCKYFDNVKVKKLMADISTVSTKFDGSGDLEILSRLTKYFKLYLWSHSELFYNTLGCNIVALAVDILCFYSLDYVLQGRFSNYGVMTFPFNRDPVHYSDYMSRTFPPFAKCIISPVDKLVNDRIETFRCHLPFMELFEKLFFILWVWLAVLIVITSVRILMLAFFFFPFFRSLIIRVPRSVIDDTETGTVDKMDKMEKLISKLRVGDVFLLYKMRAVISPVIYFRLISNIVNPQCTEVKVHEQVRKNAPRGVPNLPVIHKGNANMLQGRKHSMHVE